MHHISDRLTFYHKIGCTMFVLGFITTLYYMTGQAIVHSQFRSSNSSLSLPVYYAYIHFSSLPNVRIDEKLGFMPHFLAFTFNWEMLNQCLQSLHEPAVDWSNIILVDNSPGKLAVKRRDWLAKQYGQMIITVLPTPSLLSFSHLQNLFLSIAQQSNCSFYSWSHMDIMLLPDKEDWNARINITNMHTEVNSSNFPPTVHDKFLESITSVNNKMNNWGLIFYHYDLLAAVRTSAYISTGPFDTAIPQYAADCDYYARLRLKGYETINQRIAHFFHMPIILEHALVEEMRTCQWVRAKQILDAGTKNFTKSEERTRWRLQDKRVADIQAESILTPAGYAYYEKKWGTKLCRPNNKSQWNLDPIAA